MLRQHYGTDALDASTLLAALYGFRPGDDERLRSTVLVIADELTDHGFVLRYRTEETEDGLPGAEGTFLVCSFWLALGQQEPGANLLVPAAGGQLAELPEEVEHATIRERRLRGHPPPGAAGAERHLAEPDYEIIRGVLQALTLAVRPAAQRQPAAPTPLVHLEVRHPVVAHGAVCARRLGDGYQVVARATAAVPTGGPWRGGTAHRH
ncbi:MAG: glycoside hydrolase family 15 protein [Sporichthyaceae bacterium]|nr:glycoside hydrolase family 15 protein [Sporichthyaceae bacterium]